MPLSEENRALVERTLPGWKPCDDGWEAGMGNGALNRVIDAARAEAAATLGRVERERDEAIAEQFTTDPENGVSVGWNEVAAMWKSRATHAEAQVEALRKAADEAMAALSAAQTLMMSSGTWRNEAGHMTDAALWLERAYTALVLATPAEESGDHPGEPVAWRCKDYADGWIYYTQESAAAACRAETGCLMQPLFAQAESAAYPEWRSMDSAPDDRRVLVNFDGAGPIVAYRDLKFPSMWVRYVGYGKSSRYPLVDEGYALGWMDLPSCEAEARTGQPERGL